MDFDVQLYQPLRRHYRKTISVSIFVWRRFLKVTASLWKVLFGSGRGHVVFTSSETWLVKYRCRRRHRHRWGEPSTWLVSRRFGWRTDCHTPCKLFLPLFSSLWNAGLFKNCLLFDIRTIITFNGVFVKSRRSVFVELGGGSLSLVDMGRRYLVVIDDE